MAAVLEDNISSHGSLSDNAINLSMPELLRRRLRLVTRNSLGRLGQ